MYSSGSQVPAAAELEELGSLLELDAVMCLSAFCETVHESEMAVNIDKARIKLNNCRPATSAEDKQDVAGLCASFVPVCVSPGTVEAFGHMHR